MRLGHTLEQLRIKWLGQRVDAPYVLVVEDELAIRGLLADTLRDAGYRVVAARNGLEALDLIEKEPAPVRLLLADVGMPMMDGQVLARRIRERRPDVPVLYISGYVGSAEIGPGCAFLAKPFERQEFLNKVEQVMANPQAHNC